MLVDVACEHVAFANEVMRCHPDHDLGDGVLQVEQDLLAGVEGRVVGTYVHDDGVGLERGAVRDDDVRLAGFVDGDEEVGAGWF